MIPRGFMSIDDILSAERQLDAPLPEDYVQFCLLGGLNHLRFNHEVLSPREMLDAFDVALLGSPPDILLMKSTLLI